LFKTPSISNQSERGQITNSISWKSVITLPIIIYSISTTGPFSATKLWYNFWAIVSFDALFLILWIVVGGMSYSCGGICNACGAGVWGSCNCYGGSYKRRADIDPDLDDPDIAGSWNDASKDSVEHGIRDGIAVVEVYESFLIGLLRVGRC
jgi:hypothetical protein